MSSRPPTQPRGLCSVSETEAVTLHSISDHAPLLDGYAPLLARAVQNLFMIVFFTAMDLGFTNIALSEISTSIQQCIASTNVSASTQQRQRWRQGAARLAQQRKGAGSGSASGGTARMMVAAASRRGRGNVGGPTHLHACSSCVSQD